MGSITDLIRERCDKINEDLQRDPESSFRKFLDQLDEPGRRIVSMIGPAGRDSIDEYDTCWAYAMSEAMIAAYKQGLKDGIILGAPDQPAPIAQ